MRIEEIFEDGTPKSIEGVKVEKRQFKPEFKRKYPNAELDLIHVEVPFEGYFLSTNIFRAVSLNTGEVYLFCEDVDFETNIIESLTSYFVKTISREHGVTLNRGAILKLKQMLQSEIQDETLIRTRNTTLKNDKDDFMAFLNDLK